MKITKAVSDILSNYGSDTPGVKANLCRILMHGKLAGTGKMIILPVDQGFEHGPARSFSMNPDAYDPVYHYSLAVEAGLNAYAAPLGMLENGADLFAGAIPTILKLNSSDSLKSKSLEPDQAITASIEDALRLGCSAIGLTIYPGSENFKNMLEQAQEIICEARSVGLASVVWSYPRGGDLSKKGESALDVSAYAAHIAALLGAHIIKVKLPTDYIEQTEASKCYENKDYSSLSSRVAHIKQACFNGKRLVVFSGGATKDLADLYNDAKAIYQGGGNGSIVGRNTFQRPKQDALAMLENLTNIYLGSI